MSLLDEVRLATRTSSDAFDAELLALVAAALSDMRRAGVREELLEPARLAPMAKSAVLCYVKASFGYDNSEALRFMASYRQTLADLLNSSANMCADESDDEGLNDFDSTIQSALARMLP